MKPSCTVRPVTSLPVAVLLGLLAPSLLGAQGRIEGLVSNGTTDRPVPKQEVRLLEPGEGMEEISRASTDADGRFVFALSEIAPSAFYLVQTEFHGVNYSAPAQFDSTGVATVQLKVYESTRSDPGLRVQSLRILIRAEGRKVRVQEEYAIQNPSQPPRAYADPDGTFRFRLSAAVADPTVAVTGLMNMPLAQTPEPGKAAGEFFIRHPIKPGVTVVTVGYEADYASAQVVLRDQIPYPIDHLEMYVSPARLAAESTIFKPTGLDSTNDVQKFEAENVPRGKAFQVRLSGEAAPASSPATGQSEGEIKVTPDPVSRLGVPLFLCFLLVLLWALGIRVAKEWPRWGERNATTEIQKDLAAKRETLFNSLADLDELFASGKIAEREYWKERLELKARLAAVLKKGPPLFLDSYATRHLPR